MISKRLRCSGVASESRQDHANGTLTVRPSASWATMASSVSSNATMRGSLSAAVLIPGLHDAIQIIDNDLPNAVQFLTGCSHDRTNQRTTARTEQAGAGGHRSGDATRYVPPSSASRT